MTKSKLRPLQEKLDDVVQASSTLNQAVKACEAWDHHALVEEAIGKIREAQALLKKQYEAWAKGG